MALRGATNWRVYVAMVAVSRLCAQRVTPGRVASLTAAITLLVSCAFARLITR